MEWKRVARIENGMVLRVQGREGTVAVQVVRDESRNRLACNVARSDRGIVVDGFRKGIRSPKLHTRGNGAPGGNLQSMVAGVRIHFQQLDRANVWIRSSSRRHVRGPLRHDGALIRAQGASADTAGGVGTNLDGRAVFLHSSPKVISCGTDVDQFHDGALEKVLLEAEVGLILGRCLVLPAHRRIGIDGAGWRWRRPWGTARRWWRPHSSDRDDRKQRTEERFGSTESRVSRHAGVEEGEKLVVVDSGAGSQHGFRPGLPSQTRARLEILFADVEQPVATERIGAGHVISIKANTASTDVRLRRIVDRFQPQG